MGRTRALLLCWLAVLRAVLASRAGVALEEDVATWVQLRSNRSRRTRHTVLLSNNLYWQGYGGETLWSYFIGSLGQDVVHLGGVRGHARVGLNLMGNMPMGDISQTVSTDVGVLGLLPGCFAGCRGPDDFDDLLTIFAREGRMSRAFTLCFDDSATGGGKLFLGKPTRSLPDTAVILPMAPVTSEMPSYAPMSTFEGNAHVLFYFGLREVGSLPAVEWNTMMRQGQSYSDTGTNGFQMPSHLLEQILKTIRTGIQQDQLCQSLWGHHLRKLSPSLVQEVAVPQEGMRCATRHLRDFYVKLGPKNEGLSISKSSFFYELEPCSQRFGISWGESGSDGMILGTAFNWGRSVLYDTSDLAAPRMVLLGPAEGCAVHYGEPQTEAVPLKGTPTEVLGTGGAMTLELALGTPKQVVTMQVHTGSQKLVGIHQTCRNLGNCFLVQPVDGQNTALLPGPDYNSATCQEQVSEMAKELVQHSCSRLKTKLLCECNRQEDCLALVMEAASQHVVPKQVCALTRKMCGERVDFFPELSQSFLPAQRFPSYPFAKTPDVQTVTARCHLDRCISPRTRSDRGEELDDIQH